MTDPYYNAHLWHFDPREYGVQPIDKKILVVVEEQPRTTTGGIELADEVYSASDRGVVRVVGENVTEVAPGDRVLYNWRKGDDFVVHGEHWLFLHEDELLAKMPADAGPQW